MNRRSFLGHVTAATVGAITIATNEEVQAFAPVGQAVAVSRPVQGIQSEVGTPVYLSDGALLGFLSGYTVEPIETTMFDNASRVFIPGRVTYTVEGQMRHHERRCES